MIEEVDNLANGNSKFSLLFTHLWPAQLSPVHSRWSWGL